MKKTANFFLGALIFGVIAVPVSFMAFMYWQLYKIKYEPVPPVPHLKIEYSIEDKKSATSYAALGSYYDSNPLCGGVSLANDGRIVQSAATEPRAEMKNCENIQRDNKRFAESQGIIFPKVKYPDFKVIAFTQNNHAIVKDFRPSQSRFKLWTRKGQLKTIDERPRNYPKWRNWCFQEFHQLNVKDEIIGNVWLSTGCASSGGLSEPHGRKLPLLWKNGVTQDINSLIDPKSGWYLLKAIDINDRSQILCLAIKGNAIDAEKYDDATLHFVVLTPLK